MQDNQEKCKELAIRIYNLDEEVYKCVGSSLGRTFTGQKETTLRHLAALMYTKPDGHLLRSELALISNMARTIRDKSERRRLMIEYDSILKEIESLPDTFGQTDIVDKERISLNKSQKMTIWLSVSAVHREVAVMISDLNWRISFRSTIMMQKFLIRL